MDSHSVFWAQVDKTPNCWVWQGTQHKGYGVSHYNNRSWRAHRLAYTLIYGSVPAGKHLDHLCRNTMCVNPWHLEPVTPAENQRRKRISRLSEPKRAPVSRSKNQEARRQAWYAQWLSSFKPVFVTNLRAIDEQVS